VTEIMLLGRPRDAAAPDPGSTYTAPEGVDPGEDFDDDIPF